MKSHVVDTLPVQVRRSLKKLGADIGAARRRRRLTVAMMVERLGVAKSTYSRVEKGDPTVALGIYAMTLFVLGLGAILADIADVRADENGLMLEAERLPKRVRLRRRSEAL